MNQLRRCPVSDGMHCDHSYESQKPSLAISGCDRQSPGKLESLFPPCAAAQSGYAMPAALPMAAHLIRREKDGRVFE